MPEPLAFLNGQFIAAGALCVPVYDTGFVLGATVTEQLRTFNGRIFRLDAHLDRLRRSLGIVEIELPVSPAELAESAARLAAENHKLIEPEDDLGLAIFATPGAYGAIADGRDDGPLVAMHTFRLAFGRWAHFYESGCRLVTTAVEQIPPQCWPAELKCRSRMHYYLADLAAKKLDDQARALLLDSEGRITETSTANVVLYRDGEGLLSPRRETVLPGISLMFLQELAVKLHIPFIERDLFLDDASAADEVLLTSTPNCLLPVVALNGQPIGDGKPGSLFWQLLKVWSESAGVDIAAQARRYAAR